jgi:hypothetical protein
VGGVRRRTRNQATLGEGLITLLNEPLDVALGEPAEVTGDLGEVPVAILLPRGASAVRDLLAREEPELQSKLAQDSIGWIHRVEPPKVARRRPPRTAI